MKNELEFYNHSNLLDYINDNPNEYSEGLLHELNTEFNSLRREIVKEASWPSDKYILYLVNNLNIRLYSIKCYLFMGKISIYVNKIFECNNKLYSNAIIEKCPFLSENLIKNGDSLSYCTEKEAFELSLWSIAVEKMKHRMYEYEDEIELEFYGKSIRTTTESLSYLSHWDLTKYSIELNDNKVRVQSDFERCLGREAYREIEISSIFDLQSGNFELVDYQRGFWNYK
jgi:hypothetical protein